MPAAGHIIRVAARHRFQDAGDIVNVLHFSLLAVPAGADDDGLLLHEDMGEHLSAAYATIATQMNTNVDPYDIGIFNITANLTYGFSSWPGPYTGGSTASEALPLGVACLVLFGTTTPHKVGKVYLPPFSEGSVTNDRWLGTATTAAANWAAAIQATTARSNGYSFGYRVYSRAGGTVTTPSNARIAVRPAYQRRRRIGTGR